MNKLKCVKNGCKREQGLMYLGSFMCWYHWDLLCKDKVITDLDYYL